MANLYWVGGSTATSGNYTNPLGNFTGITGTANMNWLLAFDWNNPNNWVEKMGLNGEYFFPAFRSPSAGDNVYFGGTGTNNPLYFIGQPNAKAPCLFGGVAQSGNVVTWYGGGASGTNSVGGTNDTALALLNIVNFNKPTTSYKFANIGFGQGISNLYSPNTDHCPLLDAEAKGFTLDSSIWGEASWESLVAAVAATGGLTRLNQLKISAQQIKIGGITAASNPDSPNAGNYINTLVNQGVVDIETVKSISYYGATAGSSGGWFANTTVSSQGHHELRFKGYARTMQISPARNFTSTNPITKLTNYDSYRQVGFRATAPRGLLLLQGATIAQLTVTNAGVSGNFGSIYVGPTTNIAEFHVDQMGNPQGGFVQLYGRMARGDVLNDMGTYAVASGGNTADVPNIDFGNVAFDTWNPGVQLPLYDAAFGPNHNQVGFRGVVIGGDGATFTANSLVLGKDLVNNGDLANTALQVFFGGSAVINKIVANNCDISGWYVEGWGSVISPDSKVKIHTLDMRKSCKLSFAQCAEFDGWEFGVQENGIINGGVLSSSNIYQDYQEIRGSKGLRLWNDTIIEGALFAGNLTSTKQGKPITTTGSGNIAF